jgi:hypothetical protein
LGAIVASKKKKSPKAKPLPKKKPKKKPEIENAASRHLELRTTRDTFRFKPTDPTGWQKLLQRAAMEWTYVVRNRQRWRTEDKSSASINNRARKQLTDLGLPVVAFAAIAECGVVEVAVPFDEEKSGWEARIFPWEFVIAAATRELRQGRALTVSRVLSVSPKRSIRNPVPTKVLYVESAPSKLRSTYLFDTERKIFERNFEGRQGFQLEKLVAPTLDKLKEEVRKRKPHIIHLAGFDTHQGLRILKKDNGEIPDGYLLEGSSEVPTHSVDALTLGAALTTDKHQPLLVTFSIQNSAARTAAMAVALGAHNAIGIQDTIDDALIELFYSTFYRTWRRNGWQLHRAFSESWQALRSQSATVSGTGIVLWSDAKQVDAATDAHPKGEPVPTWLHTMKPFERLDEILQVDVKPLLELNYAQLHNKQPLFEKFTLINTSFAYEGEDQHAMIADVEVDVTLSTGTEETRYRRQVKVEKQNFELKDYIHLPLISQILRTVNEPMNSTLLVEVKWGRVLFRDSFSVRLLPVDQWRDNDLDGQWLPSFVLPRDPTVPGLISKAQHYVRVVRDDPSAGFDGYQSFDPQAEEPSAEVDLQVQAIWAMLVHELKLGYVNPPPTYSNEMDSQRLRTPSMVAKHSCGTCIDLALLIAACLENVDIYPVIFLLKDHAFPGYWRSEQAREDFMNADTLPMDVNTEKSSTTTVAGSQTFGWWFRDTAYEEIKRHVETGALVPLESVWLTEYSGFAEAIDGGRDNLKSKRRFHSMLDILKARDLQVTPLPIGDMP